MFQMPIRQRVIRQSRPLHHRHRVTVHAAIATAFFSALLLACSVSWAGQSQADTTYKDVEQTLGKVPSFLHQIPKAALPGAWSEIKAIQFSDKTALPPKMKALISLAVSAQIPCHYCVWEDTRSAKQAGASDEEIQEAVTISALTRHWSTIYNGMQVDFETFKKDLGDDTQSGTSNRK